MKPALEKVQIVAQFSVDIDGFREPGVFGPVEMTAREWATFDLQAAIEAAVAQAQMVVEDEPQPPPPNRATRCAKK